jgi:hypothetical protein
MPNGTDVNVPCGQATGCSLSCQRPSPTSTDAATTFDDPNLVSRAGLVPVMTLARPPFETAVSRPDAELVQDPAWPGYHEIPGWIVEATPPCSTRPMPSSPAAASPSPA